MSSKSIMCSDDTQKDAREPEWAASDSFFIRTAPQPPSEPAADSGGSGSQEGRTANRQLAVEAVVAILEHQFPARELSGRHYRVVAEDIVDELL